MNRHVYMSPTESGLSLNLTHEQEHQCKVVYKKSESDDAKYIFFELWNPARDYSEDYIIVPLRSSFGGVEKYDSGQLFSNIIGSTYDPHPKGYSGPWIDLLKAKGINCDKCVTDGYFYKPSDHSGGTYFTDYKCDTTMVGGHVLESFNNESPAEGSTVYLVPICHNHNSCTTDTSGKNGSGFYMITKSSGKAIVLENYKQRV